MNKKFMFLLVFIMMFGLLLCSCGPVDDKKEDDIPDHLDLSKEITLRVVGSWSDFEEMDIIAKEFHAKYPNVKVIYEQIQDYDTNLITRLQSDDPEIKVDFFVTNAIHTNSPFYDYAYDLYSDKNLDISETFPGIIENSELIKVNESDPDSLYAIPFGAEIRGMYVNVTLLKSLGIEVPTNQSELLAACAKLKENGYIPLNANAGVFAQRFLYPWVANIIANSDESVNAHAQVESKQNLSVLFKEPLEFCYNIMTNYYYDYKTAENLPAKIFTQTDDESVARYILDIVDKDENGDWAKHSDVGQVAFVADTMRLMNTLEKMKEDYHSAIEYTFIPAPVGEDGGFVYMSPSQGMAINKNSDNLDFTIEFFNFFFEKANNEKFAQAFGIMPNTSDVFEYVSELFDVPTNHISHLGQATFTYPFYEAIKNTLTDISKGNNPKYMEPNEAGTVEYNDQKVSFYSLQYYYNKFEGYLGNTTD